MPRAKTVVSLAVSYNHPTDEPEARPGFGRVARYARGRDYHNVVNYKLRKLARFIKVELPGVRISQSLADELQAAPGALLYVSDSRAWLGGLRSGHATVEAVDGSMEGMRISLGDAMHGRLSEGREGCKLRVKRLY